jgi:hypothetical protein
LRCTANARGTLAHRGAPSQSRFRPMILCAGAGNILHSAL